MSVKLHLPRRCVVALCAISLLAGGLIGWGAQSEIVLVTSEQNGKPPLTDLLPSSRGNLFRLLWNRPG